LHLRRDTAYHIAEKDEMDGRRYSVFGNLKPKTQHVKPLRSPRRRGLAGSYTAGTGDGVGGGEPRPYCRIVSPGCPPLAPNTIPNHPFPITHCRVLPSWWRRERWS